MRIQDMMCDEAGRQGLTFTSGTVESEVKSFKGVAAAFKAAKSDEEFEKDMAGDLWNF